MLMSLYCLNCSVRGNIDWSNQANKHIGYQLQHESLLKISWTDPVCLMRVAKRGLYSQLLCMKWRNMEYMLVWDYLGTLLKGLMPLSFSYFNFFLIVLDAAGFMKIDNAAATSMLCYYLCMKFYQSVGMFQYLASWLSFIWLLLFRLWWLVEGWCFCNWKHNYVLCLHKAGSWSVFEMLLSYTCYMVFDLVTIGVF